MPANFQIWILVDGNLFNLLWIRKPIRIVWQHQRSLRIDTFQQDGKLFSSFHLFCLENVKSKIIFRSSWWCAKWTKYPSAVTACMCLSLSSEHCVPHTRALMHTCVLLSHAMNILYLILQFFQFIILGSYIWKKMASAVCIWYAYMNVNINEGYKRETSIDLRCAAT